MAMASYLGDAPLASAIARNDSAFRLDNEINAKGEVYRELGDAGRCHPKWSATP